MNQILENKSGINKKIKILFIIQFYISFIFIIVLFLYWLNIIKIKTENKNISKIMNDNAKLNTIFSNKVDSLYFARIIINKINLDYFIYNDCTEELLQILPCKYSGPNLNQNGNICILGHNYLDGNFFGNLKELNKNDEIIIESLDSTIYKYIIFDKLEVDVKNINEFIKTNEKGKILTLCTCTEMKNKRLIIRAKIY